MSGRLNFFPIPEDIAHSLFNILCDIFWDSINLVYVSKLVEEGLVYEFLFTSQRESHSIPDMDFFCYTFTYFVPFGVIENRVNKVNFNDFNGNCICSSCPGS